MSVAVTRKKERRFDPTQNRVFVIGDINGRVDLLEALLDKIEIHRASNDKVVFIGNYVGKGGWSRSCIERVLDYKDEDPSSVITLLGYNDYRFIQFNNFFNKEGFFTPVLNSYVISQSSKYYMNTTFKPLNYDMVSKHRKKLMEMPLRFETKNFLFVNSGIDIEKEVEDTHPRTFLFIKEKFINNLDALDTGHKLVIHGRHTHDERGFVKISKKSINVNTNPEKTGVLSCVVLDDTNGRYVETIQVSDKKFITN